MTLCPHHRDDLARKLVPAEEIAFEYLAQRICGEVFDGTGCRMGTVIIKGIERATGLLNYMIQRSGDATGIRIVELGRIKSFGG